MHIMNAIEEENYLLEISHQLAQQLERLNRISADVEDIKSVFSEFDISSLKTKVDELPDSN